MVDVSSGINSEASSRFLSCVQCPVTTVELELSVNCVSRESAEQELGPAADSQHSVTGSGNNIGEGQMHRWEGSESSDVLFVSL